MPYFLESPSLGLKTDLLCTLNVQVIPAFEEAVSGMALGGVRRCCVLKIFDTLYARVVLCASLFLPFE